MSSLSSSDRLADTRQVTVILRMQVDRQGRILHGEVVDVDGNSRIRFKDLAGLTRTLRAWLEKQAQEDSAKIP